MNGRPTEPLPPAELGTVRRFEAAGFRAWPASVSHYDGTWLVRLTAGLAAKRLNSVNPLDPGDTRNLEERILRASRRFEASGRPLTFRLSPLAGPAVTHHLEASGWRSFSESLVLSLPLDDATLVDGAIDQIPMKDLGRFIAASIETHAADPALQPGLSEVIGAIRAEPGLFVLEQDDRPVSTGICVHDGDLAGLFEIATLASERGKGLGRRLILSALKWARLRGARTAWLQVEADNVAAIGLYRSLGFRPVYRYRYSRPTGA